MKELKLAASGVLYDEGTHKYFLNGKELRGITKVIENQLFPHQFDGIPKATLDKAAMIGSAIHKACQVYDEVRIDNGTFPQVAVYAKLMKQRLPNGRVIANEYVVTDGVNFASPIDKVIQIGDNEVLIADVKTTYSLNHDYVSWQTSIYKAWFERMNPGINVLGLIAIWLPKNDDQLSKADFFFVDDKGEDAVNALFEAEVRGEQYVAVTSVEKKEETHVILAKDAIDQMCEARRLMEHYNEIFERLKNEAMEAMLRYGVKSFDGGRVKMTLVPGGTTMRFDSAKFKKDSPEEYSKYLKPSVTKDSIRITIRDDE